MRVGLPAGLGQSIGQGRIGRQAASVGRAVDAAVGGRLGVGGAVVEAPSPGPPVSPTNGMCWRSTASRLIRSAAFFWVATSRT